MPAPTANPHQNLVRVGLGGMPKGEYGTRVELDPFAQVADASLRERFSQHGSRQAQALVADAFNKGPQLPAYMIVSQDAAVELNPDRGVKADYAALANMRTSWRAGAADIKPAELPTNTNSPAPDDGFKFDAPKR